MQASQSTPLVSIIVPTFNSQRLLEKCLNSIREQTYPFIELIVVDNYSTDKTLEIARKYTKKIYRIGSERSAQVNFGVNKAKGKYIYKVDSDFALDKNIVKECVLKIQEEFDAIIVHNSPEPTISWIAKIRKFEVDMYKYDPVHSSARFVKKQIFKKVNGFNENMIAGEDYDFQNRLNRAGYKTGYIEAEALHLGEARGIWEHMMKCYHYGKDLVHFRKENKVESKKQLSFFRGVYFRHWKTFLMHPFVGIGFILYHFLKFAMGGFGYFIGSLDLQENTFFLMKNKYTVKHPSSTQTQLRIVTHR